jgi:hypothetical protein
MVSRTNTLLVYVGSMGGWWLLDAFGLGLVPFPKGDSVAAVMMGCTGFLLMALDEIRQAISARRPDLT